MTGLAQDDITRMRDQLFFDGPERNRRLSRFWLLLPLAAVIASAGVVSDSTATVIGAMIVAPLMTPILGIVVAVALTDGPNLRRCLLLVIAGAAAVVAVGWLLGLFVPYPVVAQTNAQVAARTTLQVADLVAALATGAVGSVALVRSDISDTLARRGHRHLPGAAAGRRRPHPGIRSPPPVPGRAPAVHHQRRGHPGQRHRRHGPVPGPPDPYPAGRSGLPVIAAPSPSSPPSC